MPNARRRKRGNRHSSAAALNRGSITLACAQHIVVAQCRSPEPFGNSRYSVVPHTPSVPVILPTVSAGFSASFPPACCLIVERRRSVADPQFTGGRAGIHALRQISPVHCGRSFWAAFVILGALSVTHNNVLYHAVWMPLTTRSFRRALLSRDYLSLK